MQISVDLLQIDSWDTEKFNIYINNVLVDNFEFKHNRDDGPLTGMEKNFPGDNGNVDYGFHPTWPDQSLRYTKSMLIT